MSEQANARAYRLDDIDMLRGLAIVVMALDHVRDFFLAGTGLDPMEDPNVGAALFFTRWITHFCAPVFVFLAGTSAGLMLARKTPQALGAFLFKRGCWLIVIEIVVVSTAWTFAPGGIAQVGGKVMIGMQVIWAIGASMVVLAALQFLGRRACLLIGAAIVLGHNMLDAVWPATALMDSGTPWWVPLHGEASYTLGPFLLLFAYPLLPWVGVILLGFGAAPLFEQPPQERDRSLLRWGLAAVIAFLVLRLLDVYGDPNHWQAQATPLRTVMDFLNVTKYPPSLAYVLMTLGPALILCGCAGAIPRMLQRPLITFGRVPFAFYVAHLYLIHALSVLLGVLQGFHVGQMLTLMVFYPQGYGVGLPGVYAVWLLVIALLYPLSKWVASVKARRREWWLSYV